MTKASELRSRTRIRVLQTGFSFVLLASTLFAQVSTTSLRGVVTDPGGAVIRGAQLTLVNPDRGFTRTAITNGQTSFPSQPLKECTTRFNQRNLRPDLVSAAMTVQGGQIPLEDHSTFRLSPNAGDYLLWIKCRKFDAALSEFFERKRLDFYDWVSQFVKREVAEQLGRNQPTMPHASTSK